MVRDKFGRFIKGNIPWMTGKHHTEETRKNIGILGLGNKNMLGKHHTDISKAMMGKTRKERISKGDINIWNKDAKLYPGKYISQYKNYNGKNIPFSHYIWIKENNSKVPKGFVIHHIDGNQRNNDIKNLKLMTSKSHKQLHGVISNKIRGSKL